MKTWLALLLIATCLSAEAHIGSPNVFVADKAGEYPVRVVIRPPNVVPGLAEIIVRTAEPVQRVTVLPVFWKAGRKGSPPSDEAQPVRSETNLYSAQLWLMSSGAYSVDVTVEGSRGKGTLIVPVNSVATNTRPMTQGYSLMLAVLGMLLFIAGVKIAGAIFGEGRLDPGVLPTLKDRWWSRAAMGLTGISLALLIYGGKKWWDSEDRDYRNNSLYKPATLATEIRSERDQNILKVRVDPSARRGRWTPLIPDHGKLMHLFLIHDTPSGAFAHLHPLSRGAEIFETPLPPLPVGQYHVYADVTHEDGFAETLVGIVEIPPPSSTMKNVWLTTSGEAICSTVMAQMLATNLFFPPDMDDSWQTARGNTAAKTEPSARHVSEASGGYRITWDNPEVMANNLDGVLRFKLLAPDGSVASIEPYMGMLAHAVVRREDGTVFTHIHPTGTFSMAAQQSFEAGKSQKQRSATTQLSVELAVHNYHTNQTHTMGEVSFPYAFPRDGKYRLWVQMKSGSQIFTGNFETTVTASR